MGRGKVKEKDEVEVMDDERSERGVRSELRGFVTVVAKYERGVDDEEEDGDSV